MATMTSIKDNDRIARWLESRVNRAEYEATDWSTYQRPTRPAVAPAPVADERPVSNTAYRQPAQPKFSPLTDKQIKFVDDLLRERVHEYTEAEIAAAKADWRKGRTMIDTLKAADRKPWQPVVETLVEVEEPKRERLNFAEIADGYYAIRVDGVVKFYRVSTSKRTGYKNVQVQASDALHMLFGKAGIAVLHQIKDAGFEASQKLYAQELGRCYVCGRTLTDEESRAAGIGPICAGKNE